MARVVGVDLPVNKRIEIGLTYIYGIGRSRANSILQEAQVSPDIRVRDLDEAQVNRIRQIIEAQGEVEGDLRKRVQMDIKRLMDIGCYRGLRHRRWAAPSAPPPPPPHAHPPPPHRPPPAPPSADADGGNKNNKRTQTTKT